MPTTATIGQDIVFPFFDFSVGTIDDSISYPFNGQIYPDISKLLTQDASILRELRFEEEEVESGKTQVLTDTQQQRLAYPVYDDEDILNWDADIVPPPPRQSGKIRVKLIYKERRKPSPFDDYWEE